MYINIPLALYVAYTMHVYKTAMNMYVYMCLIAMCIRTCVQ